MTLSPPTPPHPPLAFVDTETTGLNPGRRPWEVAIVRRDYAPDGTPTERTTWLMIGDVDLSYAEPASLKVGGFYDRHPIHGNRRPTPAGTSCPEQLWEAAAAKVVERATRDAVLVGLNVGFDALTLDKMLRRHRYSPSWHYSPVDVKSMLLMLPGATPGMSSDALAGLLPSSVKQRTRHTAMGDVLWTRDLYDELMSPVSTVAPVGATA